MSRGPIKRGNRKKLGPARWPADAPIPDEGLTQVYFDVQRGDAHPDEVQALLLRLYVELAELGIGREMRQTHISPMLVKYLRGALRRLLVGKGVLPVSKDQVRRRLTADQSFGLKRTARGTPGRNKADQLRIAVSLLRRHLASGSFESAVAALAKQESTSKSAIHSLWRRNQLDALRVVKYERNEPWSAEHVRKLEKLVSTPNKAVSDLLAIEAELLARHRGVSREKSVEARHGPYQKMRLTKEKAIRQR